MPDRDWRALRILEDLFHEAGALPAQQRDAFVERQPEPLRAELSALLRELDETGEGAEARISEAIGAVAEFALRPGEWAGPYRLIRCLGQGGMGSVYLATRADNAFEKNVAVKFVRAGMDSPASRERFEAERRILARLDHPSIARLLDAGATALGSPYFVMEYVESAGNILEYCERNGLSAAERLRIFRDVCDAVHYAHKNLVIHRDLKPGNILVNPEGTPKLLDFGIAKIIDANPTGYTQPRWITPRYASPEQARGDAVTTASDIYSLGVILTELLQAALPLDRDLRTIAGKATRESHGDRYDSAAALMADLQAAADGRPISARNYTRRERAWQWARRNRLPAAASATAVLSLMCGAGVAFRSAMDAQEARSVALAEKRKAEQQAARADRQARLAQRESAKAAAQAALAAERERVALQAQALADRRYSDSSRLAGSFVHEIYAEVSALPGAARASGKLLAATIAYLEKLASQNSTDDTVQMDLASAYRLSAMLDAGPGVRAGDGTRALELLEKAQAILLRLNSRHPGDLRTQLSRVEITGTLAAIRLEQGGKADHALDEEQRNLALARQLAADHPGDARARYMLAKTLTRTVFMALQARPAAASEAMADEAVRLLRPLLESAQPGEPEWHDAEDVLADSLSAQAQVNAVQNRFAEALRLHREGLRLRETIMKRYPLDTIRRRNVMLSHAFVANLHNSMGEPNHPEARMAVERMAAIAKELASEDTASNGAKLDYAMSSLRMAAFLSGEGNIREAAELERESVRALAALGAADPDNVNYRKHLTGALRQQGDTLRAMGLLPESLAAFEWMAREGEALTKRAPPLYALRLISIALSRIALVRTRMGEDDTARAERALEAATRVFENDTSPASQASLARAMARTGEVFALCAARGGRPEYWRRAAELLGNWDEAKRRLPGAVLPLGLAEGEDWDSLLAAARQATGQVAAKR
ncbi:MAG: serine/threonine-protein kinase [Bryobacteraceae bacterium]